ncbi:hypothetical protein GE061_014963 [Apolygus lucorum]|uniref:Uncharacterized protein n=1 Tax=Apolygus lucorum TaxID=248454 RepID=A0A8S9XLU4_APOLU|nr:hypothetical protein GE061_014963 [Apolygus lucorum]
MEQSVKLRLGLALLLAQVLVYYFAPKGSSKGDHVGASVHVDFCRVSPAEKVCLTPIAALLNLCPLPKVQFAPRSTESKDDNPDDDDESENKENDRRRDENEEKGKQIEEEGKQKEETWEIRENQIDEMSANEEKIHSTKEEKQSSLIYQIIVVLLVVSVTASLADCFHERSRRKANPEAVYTNNLRGEPTLNRRMSLADLTMQRHARRESQASFRPPGKARLKTGPGGLYGAP